MIKKIFLYFLLLTILTSSNASVHIITQSGLTFSPSSIIVFVGDTVRWQWTGGTHTTTSINIPNGAANWDNPLNSTNTTFDYIVSVAGIYDYKCTPHESMGMTGRIEVVIPTVMNENDYFDGIQIPNPFSNQLQIEPEMNKPIQQMMIWDITGKMYYTHFLLIEGLHTIQTAHWPAGQYIIRLRSKDGFVVTKFLIKTP